MEIYFERTGFDLLNEAVDDLRIATQRAALQKRGERVILRGDGRGEGFLEMKVKSKSKAKGIII